MAYRRCLHNREARFARWRRRPAGEKAPGIAGCDTEWMWSGAPNWASRGITDWFLPETVSHLKVTGRKCQGRLRRPLRVVIRFLTVDRAPTKRRPMARKGMSPSVSMLSGCGAIGATISGR